MKFRLCIVAVAAAVAITAPTAAFAESFSLQNQSDAWVHLSINFPSPPKAVAPPAAVCLAPHSAVASSFPASRTHSVYLIALSGANCYAPRLWEHGVAIDGKGAVVTIGQSGATAATNSSDVVHVQNTSGAWVLLSILSGSGPPVKAPTVTSFCVAPSGHVTTLDDFPKDSKAYVIVLAGANCVAPRLHEQNANGDRIVVHGAHGAYTVTGP